MSVLCTYIPDFCLQVTYRHQPQLKGVPVAMMDADERVVAVSAEGKNAGIAVAMNPRQTQLKCREVVFVEANVRAYSEVHHAMLEEITQWELPTEDAGWGAAYVDLHAITSERDEVKKLVTELGGRLRQQVGADVVPSLGWDSGKFTAKAAAVRTLPGKMKLIDAQREAAFLNPLSIRLLPLAEKQLQWLHRLGIQTLGQYGKLPKHEVHQTLGKIGVQAQQWALGKDDRPVHATAIKDFEPIIMTVDPPTDTLPTAVETMMATMQPMMTRWGYAGVGIRSLSLACEFLSGDTRTLELTFIDPVSQASRLRQQLTHQLQTLIWPDALVRITLTQMMKAELPQVQLSLFPDTTEESAQAQEWHQAIHKRYGPVRYVGMVHEPKHPVTSRRYLLQPAA